MTRFITAVAVLSLLAGCSIDHGDPAARSAANSSTIDDISQETFALGTAVTPDGAVPKDAAGAAFRRGGEIYLSIEVSSASADQNIEVQWLDSHGRTVHRERRHVLEGARYAVFPSGRTNGWTRGAHRALVIIDGRVVSEQFFALL